MTLPYAEVIGDPIAQSKSPAIHGFWLQGERKDSEYRATRVRNEDLSEYLSDRRSDPDWRGCNVTMPHKQAILPLLDRLDPLAKKVGAVNTVTRAKDGALVGWNTDVAGFLEPLRRRLADTHYFRMARVLGTGGAARAIVAGLAKEGFTIVLAGRNPEKARAILDELAPAASIMPPRSNILRKPRTSPSTTARGAATSSSMHRRWECAGSRHWPSTGATPRPARSPTTS